VLFITLPAWLQAPDFSLAEPLPARLQVSDFNLSKVLIEDSVGSSLAVANPRWLAPEVLVGEIHTMASVRETGPPAWTSAIGGHGGWRAA
jgi:hypothetical protein